MGKPVGRTSRGLGLGMLREIQKRTERRQEKGRTLLHKRGSQAHRKPQQIQKKGKEQGGGKKLI